MYWDYVWVIKMIRDKNRLWFKKGMENWYHEDKLILGLEDKKEITNPTFLQKYRHVIINEIHPILLNTDQINDIIYTDLNGNRAFSKNVKVVCWF